MKKMTKKTLWIIMALFIISIVTLPSLTVLYAQAPTANDYNVLVPLPGVADAAGRTNLSTYLPAAFNLTVGIAVALAFVFITIGGVMYATSDALSGKTQGREYIENALWGLLLVISSYVILSTINPQILNFNILVNRPIVTPTNPVVTPVVPAGACAGGCLPFAGTGLPVSGAAVGKTISSIMMPKLLRLDAAMRANNIPWRITEGFPPSGTHQNACHQNGTCIDATPTSKTTERLNAFSAAAAANGMRAEWEVGSDTEALELTRTTNPNGSPRLNPDGTPFVPYTGIIRVFPPRNGVPQIRGTHFSVYNL